MYRNHKKNLYLLALIIFLLSIYFGVFINSCSIIDKVNTLSNRIISRDVTDKIEVLGSPYSKIYSSGEKVYARNVWDMKAFNGKLYIGAGNSSNEGPAFNAGPVPLFSYNPTTNKFVQEFITEDNQIDKFYVFNKTLYIPGHDFRGGNDYGNLYYTNLNGKWGRMQNIPGSIHTYWLAMYNGNMFAAVAHNLYGSAVCISPDMGKTWEVANLSGGGNRTYSLIQIGGQLYAFTNIKTDSTGVFLYDGTNKFMPLLEIGQCIFPGIELPKRSAKVVCPESFNEKAIYIGAENFNDHQFLPFGAYVASSKSKGNLDVTAISLPENSRPWDIIVDNGIAYLLVEDKENDNTVVRVMASKNALTWVELFHFKSETFARSFEILNGDFYFGLGCEIKDPDIWTQNELLPETGNILRLKG